MRLNYYFESPRILSLQSEWLEESGTERRRETEMKELISTWINREVTLHRKSQSNQWNDDKIIVRMTLFTSFSSFSFVCVCLCYVYCSFVYSVWLDSIYTDTHSDRACTHIYFKVFNRSNRNQTQSQKRENLCVIWIAMFEVKLTKSVYHDDWIGLIYCVLKKETNDQKREK